MNYLLHLFLSGNDSGLIVGNLLGDFVKGRLRGEYPVPIERGIALHRRIDSFSGQNGHFLRSKRRISPEFGHFRGVMVDLFYDHFLAKQWSDFTDIGFASFVSGKMRVVEKYRDLLPERVRMIVPYLFSELLPSYATIEGIDRALARMSARIRRNNGLERGGRELLLKYDELWDDFCLFFPELNRFVEEWKDISLGYERR